MRNVGPNRFEKIDEMELEQILALVRCGTDPQTATIKILGIHRSSFRNWMIEADAGDKRKMDFMARLEQARAEARSLAERRVTVRDPLAALTRGPLGRTLPDYPGWSDERTVKHTDPTGGDVPTLRVRIVVDQRGIRSEEQRAEDPRLTEGEQARGE